MTSATVSALAVLRLLWLSVVWPCTPVSWLLVSFKFGGFKVEPLVGAGDAVGLLVGR
jgi:hypothetical protein